MLLSRGRYFFSAPVRAENNETRHIRKMRKMLDEEETTCK